MNLQNLVDYCREMELPDPFSGVIVPEPLNADVVKSAIMVRSGLMTPLYNDPLTFRNATTHWFLTKQWTFEHLVNIIKAEYSPIENVFENRKETTTYGSSQVHTGGYKDAESNKDTTTHSESDNTERTFDQYHDATERTFDQYHDATERTFDQYHDATERTFDQYHDATERTFDQYHDATERTFDNYHDKVKHEYPTSGNKFTETNTKTGSTTVEHDVSAFNASTYQPSEKTTETYNQVEDAKVTTGSHEDDHTETGSYKDDRTETGSYKDDRTETGSYKDDRTETGSYKDDRTETGSYKDDRTETGSYKDTTTYGHKITTDYGHTNTRTYQNDKNDHVGMDTFEVLRHGNIGVTTNQQMINEELELLRHFDIYSYIAELFENDNMLMIY